MGESSTVVAANRISLAVTGYPVAEAKREQAGRIVHYVTGAALGAIYTMFADRMRLITTGFGGLFALGVAAVLDEGLAPRLGLSPPAAEIPLERHVEGVAAHLVYGAALETSRQVLTILA